jgi:hypothetical protein
MIAQGPGIGAALAVKQMRRIQQIDANPVDLPEKHPPRPAPKPGSSSTGVMPASRARKDR